MARTLIIGLALIVAAGGVAADDTKPVPGTPAAANASAPAAPDSVTRQGTRKQAGGARPKDGKADPAATASQELPPGGDVKMSGMSILGNEDAPKSLVLVPWKSSRLADMPSVSRLLDSSAQPVDKDVFMRELSYYEFKSGSK
jgi:hypothetical protein